jgi:hypothetical protein
VSGRKTQCIMKHTPMTKETKSKLIESAELGIEHVSKSVDEVRNFIKKVKLMTDFITENEFSIEDKIFDNIEKLLEYRLLIGLIYLDLASAMRAHLNSKYTYEQLLSIRQIIVTINEGYKQIYNFVKVNENGDSVTRYRKKSYWYEDIRVIINESITELKPEYDFLTKKLDDYFAENFEAIKEQRDLSVHYDRKASKVYDMIIQLEVEVTFKKLSPFLAIITEMFLFTEKMASISQGKEKQKNIEMHNKFESVFLDIENKIKNEDSNANPEVMDKLKELTNKIRTDFLDKIKSPNT